MGRMIRTLLLPCIVFFALPFLPVRVVPEEEVGNSFALTFDAPFACPLRAILFLVCRHSAAFFCALAPVRSVKHIFISFLWDRGRSVVKVDPCASMNYQKLHACSCSIWQGSNKSILSGTERLSIGALVEDSSGLQCLWVTTNMLFWCRGWERV